MLAGIRKTRRDHRDRRDHRGPWHGSMSQTSQKSKGFHIKDVLRQDPLGRGEFGATYKLTTDRVVKVIRISNPNMEKAVLTEVEIHKEAAKLRLPDNRQCVPPIYSGPFVEYVGAAKYVAYTMPTLKNFEPTRQNYSKILSLNEFLVANGFLHNDLHQGNIMMFNGEPIIIDLGLMRRFAPPTDPIIRRCITFGQNAALVDNCNNNTKCPTKSIMDLLADDRTFVIQSCHLSARDSRRDMARKVQSLAMDPETRLQLLLACLSTRFLGCGYIPKICDGGQDIGDAVYAIRNPQGEEKTLQEVYRAYFSQKIV